MAHGELRTNLIVDHLLKRGNTAHPAVYALKIKAQFDCPGTSLYTPYIPAPPARTNNPSAPSPSSPSPEHDMRMLRLYTTQDLKNCPLDRWGIIDPGVERKDVEKSLREDGTCAFPRRSVKIKTHQVLSYESQSTRNGLDPHPGRRIRRRM